MDSLINKIDFVLSNPEKAKQIGNEAFNVIKNRINIDTVAQRYIEAFEWVLRP